MDGCFYTMTYSNKLCINDENNSLSNNKYVNDRYENFSTQSKCVKSTASSGVYGFSDEARCHLIKCAPDFSYITITIT